MVDCVCACIESTQTNKRADRPLSIAVVVVVDFIANNFQQLNLIDHWLSKYFVLSSCFCVNVYSIFNSHFFLPFCLQKFPEASKRFLISIRKWTTITRIWIKWITVFKVLTLAMNMDMVCSAKKCTQIESLRYQMKISTILVFLSKFLFRNGSRSQWARSTRSQPVWWTRRTRRTRRAWINAAHDDDDCRRTKLIPFLIAFSLNCSFSLSFTVPLRL